MYSSYNPFDRNNIWDSTEDHESALVISGSYTICVRMKFAMNMMG